MLCIVAVVGIDLGFTLLVGSENTPNLALDTPVRDLRPVVAAQTPAEVPPAPADANIIGPSADRKVASRRKASVATPQYSPTRVKPVLVAAAARRDRPISRASVVRYAAATAQPKYAVGSPLTFGPYVVATTDNISYRSAELRREKRRSSFTSKATLVVKKPWQWMKSLVSKLR